MSKLRVFEAFSGYGSQSIALDNIGVPNEVVAISEIDADVIISYGAIRYDLSKPIDKTDDEIKEWLMSKNIGYDFQKQKSSIPRMNKQKLYKLYNACIFSNNLGDVSIINPTDIPDNDLFTYSFPCTDISVAGQTKGLEKGSGTRSGLLWECEKIIKAKKPKYLLMENVKNLVGKQFKAYFDEWGKCLEEQGYTNYYKVLNAKDYGIPQNRERIFMISVLEEDIDYIFPDKMKLELRLKDILENEVDDKYYIDSEKCKTLISQLKDKNSLMLDMCQAKREGKPREYTDISPTISARDWKEPRLINCSSNIIKIGNLECSYEQSGRVYSPDGISPTVMSNSHGKTSGGYIPIKVLEYPEDTHQILRPVRTEYGKEIRKQYELGEVKESRHHMTELQPREACISNTLTTVQKDNLLLESKINIEKDLKFIGGIGNKDWVGDGKINSRNFPQGNRVYDSEGIACTQTSQGGGIGSFTGLYLEPQFRIRKLTPKECWRLMGMNDKHFDKCVEMGICNSQLYKQAGNSIVVDVLEYIFKELFIHSNKN